MTICIGVVTNNAIVFVADSATSYSRVAQNGDVITDRVYNGADKVFSLWKGKPVCAMTCGNGAFGRDSISTISKKIRADITNGHVEIDPETYIVKDIAEACQAEFTLRFNELPDALKPRISFSFFIGGISAQVTDTEVWRLSITNGKVSLDQVVESTETNVFWDGQPEACNRLVTGFAGTTRQTLLDSKMTEEQADTLMEKLQLSALAHEIINPSMPVRDSIELARFLAETTSKYVKFLPGADIVGGELDIAVVTKYEGFKWVQRKHYYPKNLNLETDHATT